METDAIQRVKLRSFIIAQMLIKLEEMSVLKNAEMIMLTFQKNVMMATFTTVMDAQHSVVLSNLCMLVITTYQISVLIYAVTDSEI